MLTAGIAFDQLARTVTIVGSEGGDVAEVRQQDADLILTLNSAAGQFSRTIASAAVGRILFMGLAGNDFFANQSAIPSRASGGPGADVLRGGSAAEELLGGWTPAPSALRHNMAVGDLHQQAWRQPYAQFFAVEEYDLSWRRFDGGFSQTATRAAVYLFRCEAARFAKLGLAQRRRQILAHRVEETLHGRRGASPGKTKV